MVDDGSLTLVVREEIGRVGLRLEGFGCVNEDVKVGMHDEE